MDINKRVEIAVLVKYYGSMLTEKQLHIIEMYVDNNLSLSEVSEELNITRQAVKDALDNAVSTLESIEDRLHFIERDDKIKNIINDETNVDRHIRSKILAILEGN